METIEPVERRDYGMVALFTLLLYAIVLACGGPLTMHEGVLSQTTKAMLADHDWLVPHYGDAPWLERPPLPQWISCAICSVIGHCDQEWNVRIGPALAGTLTVLLTLWLAGRLFGRATGIVSALILATMYNFVRYSTLAEADIFLAPIVGGALCCFAYVELLRVPQPSESNNFFGKRPWPVLLFFVLLGMTNLAKGLVFGMVIVMAPIGVFMIWNANAETRTDRRDLLIFLGLYAWAFLTKLLGLRTSIGLGPMALFFLWNIRLYTRYLWLWGWLAFAVVALPWPILAYLRYPDAVDVWTFDLQARLNANYLGEPPWYYFVCLTWVSQPWAIAVGGGLLVTFRSVWNHGSPALRFVWCWAWMPLLIYSLADGKHHHYMLHYLAPWAILAAHGAIWSWKRLSERLLGERIVGLVAAMFVTIFVLYGVGFAYKGAYLHRSREDTAFLLQARSAVPMEMPLMINSADEALEGLRMQFYLGDQSYFLHNLSFVRDDRVHGDDIYVVTRFNRRSQLEKYGRVEPIIKCKHSRREASEEERWTLFHVHLRENLERKSANVRISPMQAMYRAEGPDLD
ncbi:MAG TPA: glycosyltransferase family 39 protein [Gemmataceae bacterium]|nr:glycosyltransferase family 39 protein [Gemmataceae bacterium]